MKILNELTENELMYILKNNNEIDLNRLGAYCAEILRRIIIRGYIPQLTQDFLGASSTSSESNEPSP